MQAYNSVYNVHLTGTLKSMILKREKKEHNSLLIYILIRISTRKIVDHI